MTVFVGFIDEKTRKEYVKAKKEDPKLLHEIQFNTTAFKPFKLEN